MAFGTDYTYLDKRCGEISQVKMFTPNIKKSHTT